MQSVADELSQLVETAYARLATLGEDTVAAQPPTGWTKKEELGHLIDSAANNHQRFVRLQHTPEITLPGYQADDWVRTQQYRDRPWTELVLLWRAYNRHLAHIIGQADPACMQHIWHSPEGDLKLDFIMRDYVVHMRHHLDEILS